MSVTDTIFIFRKKKGCEFVLKKFREFKNKKIEEAQIKKFGTKLDNAEEIDDKEIYIAEQKVKIELAREKFYRSQKIKWALKWAGKVVLSLMVLGVLANGLSLQNNVTFPEEKGVVNRTVLKEYVQSYFQYPSSEEIKKNILKYSVRDFGAFAFDESVLNQKIDNIEIYKIDKIDSEKYEYYLSGNLVTTLKQNNQVLNRNIYFKIKTHEKDKKVLITQPLEMIVGTENLFSDEDKKVLLEQLNKNPKGKNETSDKEKNDLKIALDLFFKTYSEDRNKALVLTSNLNLLELSKGTKLQLKDIKDIVVMEQELFVVASVNEQFEKTMSIEKTYVLLIDKSTKKIKKVEVR